MSSSEIRAAVEAARASVPSLPSDYADRAIAAGKSLATVKAELFGEMTISTRERGKANMRAQIALSSEGRAALASADAGQGPGAATAALADARARGRTLMADEVRRQGMAPKL